jgi:hypothetical protein
VAAVQCVTCVRTNGGRFRDCVVLSNWFGNECANCIFEHGYQIPEVIDLTRADEEFAAGVFCRHIGRPGDGENNPIDLTGY